MNRFPALLAGLALTASGLTACSTGPTDRASDDHTGSTRTGGAEDGAYPVTIEHAFGETTISEAPQRVVTVGWSDADLVADLGVVPVGVPAITWGGNANQSTDWFDARLKELGGEQPTQYDDADGIPFDELAQLQPDLVLATNSGLTQADYTKLKKMGAHVVAYPDQAWGTPWQDSLEMVGDALGRPDAADALEDETEQAIADAQKQYPDLVGKTAAWGWLTEGDTSTIGLCTSLDNRPRMLEEFGMEEASIVSELGSDAFSANLSSEKADTLDADVFVYYAEGAPQDPAADALLGRIPALKRGSYLAVEDRASSLPMSSPTTLSIPVAIRDFLPQLNQAAQQVD